MGLFQKSVLINYLTSVSGSDIEKGWNSLISYKEMDSKVQTFKEEVFQAKFLEKIFVDCFGYKSQYDSAEEGNLFFEQKNTSNSKKADGAIKKDGEVIAVIELKSTKTKNLDDVKNQAFGYYTNNSKCEYVITSNFNKLRFYIERNEDYLEFDLFNIDKEEFKLLWLCLDSKNLLEGKPKEIKNKSLINEENITKKLYQDYSTFRQELFNNLIENNQTVEKRVILNKTQKLLDRLLFILFSEDRGLLPANSISEIINHWEFGGNSLYSTFLTYFEIINKGRPKRGDKKGIYAYNGGLFSEDVVLNTLNISDDVLLSNAKKLTKYDFESDVSVDILGHIFEHSLSEIEELQNQIDGVETDKSKSKRKKDGVYYTPKYITKYIVDNTLGKLCDEKKIELDINEETYSPSAKRSRNRISALDDYRSWLLQLTICDPACGSGAFLIQALNFLIKEHHYIDELSASYNKDSLLLSDVKNSILENNLYGVDINQESVEIAKLSLWLNTAESNRKLTSLNNNIKCGNSLIDNPEVAGDKAFNWQNEFPKVFERGGFDVVVGNPPYIRKQGLMEHYPEMCIYYESNYKSATANYDIYALFMEKTFDLINDKGIVSFILPHKFLIADFGNGIRQYFIDNKAVSGLIHFGAELVFRDATTYTCIINLTKDKKKVIRFKHLKPSDLFENFESSEIPYSELSYKQWILSDKKVSGVLKKINLQPLKLKDIFARFVQGIITGKDAVFCVKGNLNGQFLIILDEKGVQHKIEKEILKPHLRGEDVAKFKSLVNNEWLIFPYVINDEKAELISPSELKDKYPNTLNYLKVYEDVLREREKGKFNNEYWYQFSRNQAISVLEQDKIITREVCFGGSMTLDENNFYHNSKCHTLLLKENTGFSYKSILPLINSSLFWFYLSNTGNELRGGYIGVKRKVLEPFSVPNPESVEIKHLENFTDLMLKKKSKHLSVLNNFTKYLKSQIKIENLSKKLLNWYKLEFGDFIKELNKAIKKAGGNELDNKEKFNLMPLFEEQKSEAQRLKDQINQTDKEIDQMVYELYGLTKEEIEIVENS